MEWVKTINNAIEYMENHLTDDITLSDIAESVYISAFHFQRAFSMMAGISPAEYLRNRRLSQAGAELANGNERVIDIAMKYGYESSESFTKAFSRFHGFSPMQVRKGSPLKYMNRYTIRITIDGGSIMEYKIEKWEAITEYELIPEYYIENYLPGNPTAKDYVSEICIPINKVQ